MPGQPGKARAVIGFAHRGGMADRPENSLAAFGWALSSGATALEADVWLAPDGAARLSHGRAGPAAPTLADLFDACGTDFDLSLDLPGAAVPAVLAATRAAGHDPRRLWLCGGGPELVRWQTLAPQVRMVSAASRREVRPGRAAFLDGLQERGVAALNLQRRRWTAGLVDRVHRAGLLVFAWDVQTEAQLRHAFALGVDAVYCDHVTRLVAVLGRADMPRPEDLAGGS